MNYYDRLYDKIKDKIPERYYLIKEFQKWGHCFTFKNDDGKCLFVDESYTKMQFKTGSEMYSILHENWCPASQDGQDYFCNGMDELLKL